MENVPAMVRRRQAFWWVRTLFNPLAKTTLRSPLHGGMSRRLLLITFPGRKSGKQYTTPISYVQHGDTLLLGVGGRWWKNLRGGVPVQVRLRGVLPQHAVQLQARQARRSARGELLVVAELARGAGGAALRAAVRRAGGWSTRGSRCGCATAPMATSDSTSGMSNRRRNKGAS